MKRFLDLIRSPKPSSADLRAALDANDVEAAQAEHDRLRAEHADLLMDGDDTTLDALEARIAAARRQVERTTIIRDQLTAGLADAELREAAEALSAERKAVEAEAGAVAKAIKVQYPKLAGDLRELLERLAASERAVAAVNTRLHEAGRSDEVLTPVETRAYPLGPHEYGPARSLLTRTALAAIPGRSAGWNDPLGRETWSGNLPINRAPAIPRPFTGG